MDKKEKIILCIVVFILLLILILLCCWYFKSDKIQAPLQTENNNTSSELIVPTNEITQLSVKYTEEDLKSEYNTSDTENIILNDNTIESDSSNVSINGSNITIQKAGTYILSGNLTNGSIIVDTTKDETIRLVLNNVNINCNTTSPLYVKTANKVILTLAQGSTNIFTDGSDYKFEDEEVEPNATIFSKEDIVINGEGTLKVIANYEDGIVSKDKLKIVSGTIEINAQDDGIRGKDCIGILNGNIRITANGDGIKSTNNTETDKGFILIENGNFDIIAQKDGIKAETNLQIIDGNFNITSGGGSNNATKSNNNQLQFNTNIKTTANIAEETESMKGIKVGVQIAIQGGTFNIDSLDDAIHSNNSIIIQSGKLNLASGDDCIHADTNILIEQGEINITKSYEGIESPNIIINEGKIYIVSSDDGINVSDGSSSEGIKPAGIKTNVDSNLSITINGGYIVIDSSADGIDSNASIYINGGTIIINGPTNAGNSALDYEGECLVNGGILLATGSIGMAQTVSNTSKEYCVSISFSNVQEAGEIINIKDSVGQDILTFSTLKNYQSLVFCSPELKKGETYTIYTGGTYTNDSTDGIYKDGTYSGGIEYTKFTVNNIVTNVGNVNTGMNNMGGKGGHKFNN